MKTKFYFILISLIATSIPMAFGSGRSSRGTTAADFLKHGAGARAVSLGEAYSAVAKDATALYWNPAALTYIHSHSVVLMHTDYLESSSYNFGAYGAKIGDRSALAFSGQYFSTEKIDQKDINNQSVGTFSPSDLAVSAGFARKVNGHSIGLSGKFIQSKIVESAHTAAIDFGYSSKPYFRNRWNWSFVVTNLGGDMKFDAESEKLPLTFTVGSSLYLTKTWLLAWDVDLPRDNSPVSGAGTEVQIPIMKNLRLAGRLGYNTGTSNDLNAVSGLSFGLGIFLKPVAVDYGIRLFDDLGSIHLISLSFDF